MGNSEEDLYNVLGITPNASPAEIREAYLYKVNILHPDRLQGMSRSVRRRAEEDLKMVNRAYEVLGNEVRRRQYDINRFGKETVDHLHETRKAGSTGKPQPEVYPGVISFSEALPYVANKQPFFVRNKGGPYSRVMIGVPPEWIRIAKTIPLQLGHKLPMQVNLEAVGIQWGKTYSADVRIRLDDCETKVRVELRMAKKPR